MRRHTKTKVNFTYEYNQVRIKVERETSEVAKKQFDKEGNSLFEEYVMDEQYEDLLAAYMQQAGAIVRDMLSAYLISIPENYDDNDIDKDNVVYYCAFPHTFVRANITGIDESIYEYLVCEICRKWYISMLPNVSAVYQVRAETALRDIKHRLNMRVKPITRPYKII